jgi:ribosomal protein S18 acetylase RimI-like enzyme
MKDSENKINSVIRDADLNDIDFVIKAIIEAEKSGTDKVSYSTIFSLNEIELKIILRKILEDNIPGHQLWLSGFMIAEIDGEKAGACCGWIECSGGLSSTIIKANLFLDVIGREKLIEAKPIFGLIQELNIERKCGTLQIDYVYVTEKFRGLGLSGFLINSQIKKYKLQDHHVRLAQLAVAESNQPAVKTYVKSGFTVNEKKHSDNKEILKYLPSDTIYLMSKEI